MLCATDAMNYPVVPCFTKSVKNNKRCVYLKLFRNKVNGSEEKSDPEMDERLKNIEPKMVELITNEVSHKSLTIFCS